MDENTPNPHTMLKYKAKTPRASGFFLCEERDVVFNVESEKIYSNRQSLSAESEFFQTLFDGGFMKENILHVTLLDTRASVFKILLNVIYMEELDLSKQNLKDVVDLMKLSHRYDFTEIEAGTVEFLKAEINVENVLLILSKTVLLNEELATMCCEFLSENLDAVTAAPDFARLTIDTLIILLQNIKQPIQTKFQIASKWLKCHKKKILSAFELPQERDTDLTNLITTDTLNVLQGTSTTLWKSIAASDTEHILQLKFGDLIKPISKLTFKFSDAVKDGYSVQVSKDLENWTDLVNYQTYECRGKQKLYFDLTEPKYLQIISENAFNCHSLKYSYCFQPPNLVEGFIGLLDRNMCVPIRATISSESGEDCTNLFDKDNIDALKCKPGKSFTVSFNQPYWLNCYKVHLTGTNNEGQMVAVRIFGGTKIETMKQIIVNTSVIFIGNPMAVTSIKFEVEKASKNRVKFSHVEAFYILDPFQDLPGQTESESEQIEAESVQTEVESVRMSVSE